MRRVKSWDTSLDITPESIQLLVTESESEVLRAQFCGHPVHPRALPFILEGLALWSGKQLCVVIYAETPVHPLLGLGEGGDQWPRDNPLVEFLHVERPSHGRHRCGGHSR
jgi:hypothetical protein